MRGASIAHAWTVFAKELADAARFKLADVRQIGDDLRLTLLPA